MKDLTISVFGLAASLLVIAILVFMEIQWGFAFYSIMHFFVIPTGAIISGIGAAGGYYLGALILNARPTPKILFNMVAISVGAYFTLNYAMYLLLEVDGVPVSGIVNFSEYMDVILTSMSMTIGRGSADTGELGSLGYVVATLQVLGFALGGATVYMFLRNKAFCEICAKYYKREWRDTRYSGERNQEELLASIQSVAKSFDEADVDSARKIHAETGTAKHSKETHLRTQLTLEQCPECHRRLLSFTTSRQKGNDWEEVGDLTFATVFAGTREQHVV